MFSVLQIAQVCHETIRAYCNAIGDNSQVPWDECPEWQRNSCLEGVGCAIVGSTPKELHQSWCEAKVRDGWKYGSIKDPEAKTHPCLVPYESLPSEQRVKDALFNAVVIAMTAKQ